MDSLLDFVQQRKIDIMGGRSIGWAANQLDLTIQQRQRGIAMELFKAWRKTSENDQLIQRVVVKNTLNEECHVIFVKTLRTKAVSIAVKHCGIGKNEAYCKSIVILYEKWSKAAWEKIKQIPEGRNAISIFNSSLLTLPLTRYINKTVTELRGSPTTYWSLLSHKRMRRGYSRLESTNEQVTLRKILNDCGATEDEMRNAFEEYSGDLNVKLESERFDDVAIEMPDDDIATMLKIFQRLKCDSKVTAISDFNRAIVAINNRKRYNGDLEDEIQELKAKMAACNDEELEKLNKDIKTLELRRDMLLEELLRKLPRMSVFDPVNLYLGARVGDIVKIKRDDSMYKPESMTPMYRLVTSFDNIISEEEPDNKLLGVEEENGDKENGDKENGDDTEDEDDVDVVEEEV